MILTKASNIRRTRHIEKKRGTYRIYSYKIVLTNGCDAYR